MVNNFDFKDRDGNTPITEEQRKGLKHDINLQGELDELEEENITHGLAWLSSTGEDFMKYDFWKKAHKKHFDNVWSWAGEVRSEPLENPYFFEPGKISTGLAALEKDLAAWLKFNSYPPLELLAQFHLKLVTIHPFPNGNGRISRILTEHLARKLKIDVPTWGRSLRSDPENRRTVYIGALNYARQENDLSKLLDFMNS